MEGNVGLFFWLQQNNSLFAQHVNYLQCYHFPCCLSTQLITAIDKILFPFRNISDCYVKNITVVIRINENAVHYCTPVWYLCPKNTVLQVQSSNDAG